MLLGSQMKQISLEQRLGGLCREGSLRSNPPDSPFWIPEENPLLLAWDMTVDEYCQAVCRAAGLYPQESCRQTFRWFWPVLERTGWNLSLIRLLGDAWLLLHPGGQKLRPSGPGYTPDPDPPAVWRSWGTGPAERGGSLKNQDALFTAIACLILRPFARMEQQEQAGNPRGKDDET